MTAIATDAPSATASRGRLWLRLWLYVVALMIVGIVVVGGATRLTHSGLSITEWQPVHGVIPPLNDAEWQDEFAKYQQIPEYKQINAGMTLGEFKFIFWWEWTHRLLARLIGIVALLPPLVLLFFRRVGWNLKLRLLSIPVLVGVQGAVGWWMVASGLVDRTDVSQYRLATHLTLACAILAWVIWLARSLSPRWKPASSGVRIAAGVIVLMALVQIFLGGLVAGLDAGLAYNTWPTMNGELVPSGLFSMTPWWRNLFENGATVQFDHRLGAYTLFALALINAFAVRRAAAWALAFLVTVQAGLGISTLLLVVPLPLALIHQLGAVVVLAHAVGYWRGLTPPLPVGGALAGQDGATAATVTPAKAVA